MRGILVAMVLPLAGCSEWFFSGESWIDRSRPAVLVETTGGIEYGAATEFGVLTLGRSAQTGPCRVHYFLGPTPLVESGELKPAGGVFTLASIELKTQLVRALDRAPTADDVLMAMWTEDGQTTRTASIELARDALLAGDVLRDPGTPLPTGATVLCRGEEGWLFAGLVAGKATVEGSNAAGTYYVFAGVDRVRELLAHARQHDVDEQPKYRTDDIRVMQPQPQVPTPVKAKEPAAPEPPKK